MDDGPAAGPAAPGLSGQRLDAACRALAALPRSPVLAGPAWWDANAPARRVTHISRPSLPLAPAPWHPERALRFCSELALALDGVHEAQAAHGALRPGAVEQRPDGGPLVRVPAGDGTPADDLHGLGVLLLELLTGRRGHAGLVVTGEDGPAAETAALLHDLLNGDAAARPGSARIVGDRLAELAAVLPPEAIDAERERRPRRRGRMAIALALLALSGGSAAYVAASRVGPPGPALSPGTVSVPPTVASP